MSHVAIVLDSTVYKQSPLLNTQLFQYFRKQCRVGVFRLYIPEVVEREYVTWIEEQVSQATSDIAKAIHSMNRLVPGVEIFGMDLLNYIADSELKGRQSKTIENWEAFKSDTNATIIPIANGHGARVMDDYFQGKEPFRQRKSREDIPDAFIRSALLDLLPNEAVIHFITRDKRFAESLKSIAHVVVSSDLNELLQHPDIKSRTGLAVSGDAVDASKQMLAYFKDEFHTMIIKAIVNEIDGNTVGEQFFESYMNDPTAFSSVEVGNFELDKDSITIIGDRTLLIPFLADVKADVAYGIQAGDLQRLGKSRVEKLESREEADLGYYDIIEAFPVKPKGSLSMKYSGTDPKTWRDINKEVQFRVEVYDFIWE